DLLGELGHRRQHVGPRHPRLRGDVEEPAVHHREGPGTVLSLEAEGRDLELNEDRLRSCQGPRISLDAAGALHPAGSGPDASVRACRRHQVDIDPHALAPSTCMASSTASSMPLAMKNAFSGSWSVSPTVRPRNDLIVTLIGVYLPYIPVNCSATKNGWDRNR